MRKYVALLIMIVLTLVMTSCDKSSEPNNTNSFSLNLKLVDSNNEPLAGYVTTIFPLNDELPFNYARNRHELTLFLTVPKADNVKVEIFDYFGNKVTTLLDEELEAGRHSLVYNSAVDRPDGIYEAIYTYHDDEGLEKSLSCYLYQFSEYNLDLARYITDEKGKIKETNILPFPYLYYENEFTCTNEMGSMVGTMSFSSPTCVKIANSEGVIKTATFNITNGVNNFELNWDEMTIVDEDRVDKALGCIDTDSINIPLDKKGKEGPSLEAQISAAPNPFN